MNMNMHLHPRRGLRRLHRLLCTALVVLSLVTALVPAASAASDLDGGLTVRQTVNLTPTAAASQSVRITRSGQVVDTFNGVPAKYIPGSGNSNTGTYSCAGYVKAYCKACCGVDVYNLTTGATPKSSTSGCSFQEIFSGFQAGDIVYMTNSKGTGHWAIAKAVSGSSITLIEQNWKWVSQGSTYASVNRVVTYGSTANMRVFRLVRASQPSSGSGSSGSSSSSSGSASSGSYSRADVEALLFNARYYANTYPDLRQAFGYDYAALLRHWKEHGQAEGRTASPIFDSKWYLANNPDVAKAYGATNYQMAYNHFCAFGFAEGRQGSPIFSAKTYLGLYPDLRAAFGSNYLSAARHFLSSGISELRQASSQFSLRTYSAANPDVTRAFSNPLDRISHYVSYVQYGKERRTCV